MIVACLCANSAVMQWVILGFLVVWVIAEVATKARAQRVEKDATTPQRQIETVSLAAELENRRRPVRLSVWQWIIVALTAALVAAAVTFVVYRAINTAPECTPPPTIETDDI